MKTLQYITIVCLAVLLALPAYSQTPREVKVFVTPDTSTVNTGDNFEVEVTADLSNTGDLLGSFTVILTWNPNSISYLGNSDLESGFGGIINKDNVAIGQLAFDGTNIGGNGGLFPLLNVQFEAGAPGYANINLEVSALGAAATFQNLLPSTTVESGAVNIDASLPIDLLRLTAKYQENLQAVTVNWAATTEAGAVFEIEHSLNGKDFKKIGQKQSSSIANKIVNYDHLHANPQKGLNYYRLKILYSDGASEYSPITVCTVGKQVFSVFPNPVSDYLFVQLEDADINRATTIEILDAYGRTVKRVQAEFSSTTINVKTLPAGVYTISISDGFQTIVRNFTKLQ